MTTVDLKSMSTPELLDRFADNGIKQDSALLYDEGAQYNKLFRDMDAINKELLRRGKQAQLQLLKLYGHRNMQVRLQAAMLTMTTAPAEAKVELEAIKNSRHFPQAGDAGMALREF
jgi:hypothetical protein